ncbi:glycoside hydrolase family 78 protein [Phytohabitans rumicis]|uniref:alpha-L-rhamnosidase n=1 Tax=Phytohabitans rumicis TaxID=1076125 RepID=A0A6V8KW64_9ACTN|nr:glycoside hydrolase family 78 protein [Phytohabitans rumicis]GFJ87630.1 alpha-L-rhamnosidase [Phytohabitans rumicis]
MSAGYQDRGAVFIGPRARPTSEAEDPAVYFRREFEVAQDVVSATLWVTALGVVEPYLNGAPVGDEVLDPGWTSYRHRLVVRSHDVTHLVRPGANAFGAIVGEGWATGRLGYAEICRRRQFADRVGLFAVIDLNYSDRREVVVTDRLFRAGEGSVRANSVYDGVTIDARMEPNGWHQPGFDDSGWGPVEAIEWDRATLVDPVAPPIRRIEELAPRDIRPSRRATTIVDFGQNISGWVRLRLTGPRGRLVTIRHAEVLVDGLPDYTTLRTAQATDRYLLAGSGTEEFEPRFTYHGFRYAEIEGLPHDISPDDVRAVVVHSDMTRTGWFETSDELVNRLHENVVWSMRDNFVGLPTDCPQRDERLGWTGDINAFAPTAAYLYDVSGVLGSWLADLAAEQRERGFVPYVVPDVQGTYKSPAALWSDVAVSLPWALYWQYGDIEILRRSYESMVAFTRSVEALLDERGLWSAGFQFGDWLDPSAPLTSPRRGKTDPHLVATAYLAKVAREMAATAQALGQVGDAKHFTALVERVRAAFRAEYVTPNGRITNESATAYALAIQFGLLDAGQLPTAGTRLADLVRRDAGRISTGFAGTPHVAHALTRTGHTDAAYALLLQREAPSFLYPVTRGATTIWERWDAILPDGTVNPSGMTSLNHYALGSIAHWLHAVVAGLEATSPGYRTVRIAPQPGGGLTFAKAAHDTPRGRLAVRWHQANGTMELAVVVPPGTTAIVELPLHPTGDSERVGPGEHRWTYPARQRPHELALDSPIDALAGDDATWARIAAILQYHLPHLPLDAVVESNAAMPLSAVLNDFSALPASAREEIAAAIQSEAGGNKRQPVDGGARRPIRLVPPPHVTEDQR